MPGPPAREYQERLDARRRAHATLSQLDARISLLRLAAFGIGVATALLAWRGVLPWWLLALPALAFAALMHWHDRVITRRDAAACAVRFYEHGLARIEDRWAGFGSPGTRFRDDHHPYANDLDLFGDGSLFQMVSIARTRAGEETLASWLKEPAPPDEIRARQAAVDELSPDLDLREALALGGSDAAASVDSDTLPAWAEGSVALRYSWLRIVAAVLSLSSLVTAGWWMGSGAPGPFITVLMLEILFFLPQRRLVQRALHAAEGPARDLDVLAHVLGHVEQRTFTAPRLVELRRALDTAGEQASTSIRALHRLVELHDWQHNQFFALFASTVLWGTHLAYAIERWRVRHGRHVRGWLQTVGTFEALNSLAARHYEQPDDAWPEVLDGGSAVFDAKGLGHPLLPTARLVRNDVTLDAAVRLLIVSGSNMSGKSTLLRTVGINAVLAQAGAPVRATSLRLTPLSVGATLRIQDSLQEGRSRFFAEITRLRELADAARGPRPLLFLLDEILHGTNSHDRLVGAAGVLRSLLNRGAIGLVTTHDLALTAMAAALPQARNVHFEDRVEADEIEFDYRLKDGPVTRSNAIALMRAVGLEVGPSVTSQLSSSK